MLVDNLTRGVITPGFFVATKNLRVIFDITGLKRKLNYNFKRNKGY